jgi:hypothetical protein
MFACWALGGWPNLYGREGVEGSLSPVFGGRVLRFPVRLPPRGSFTLPLPALQHGYRLCLQPAPIKRGPDSKPPAKSTPAVTVDVYVIMRHVQSQSIRTLGDRAPPKPRQRRDIPFAESPPARRPAHMPSCCLYRFCSQRSARWQYPQIRALHFQHLAHSFPRAKSTTLPFSCACALFHKQQKSNPRISNHFHTLRALLYTRAKTNFLIFNRVRTLL